MHSFPIIYKYVFLKKISQKLYQYVPSEYSVKKTKKI